MGSFIGWEGVSLWAGVFFGVNLGAYHGVCFGQSQGMIMVRVLAQKLDRLPLQWCSVVVGRQRCFLHRCCLAFCVCVCWILMERWNRTQQQYGGTRLLRPNIAFLCVKTIAKKQGKKRKKNNKKIAGFLFFIFIFWLFVFFLRTKNKRYMAPKTVFRRHSWMHGLNRVGCMVEGTCNEPEFSRMAVLASGRFCGGNLITSNTI